MNVLQRISYAASILLGVKSKGSEVYGTDWLMYLKTGKITKDEYYQGIVFSCVDIIAKAASAVPFALVKAQEGDRTLILDEDDTVVESHDIIKILTKPNQIQSWADFSFPMYSYFALHGETFVLPNASTSGWKIKELFLLTPLNIQIEEGTNNFPPIKKRTWLTAQSSSGPS
jgi:phage portal protein BeeE